MNVPHQESSTGPAVSDLTVEPQLSGWRRLARRNAMIVSLVVADLLSVATAWLLGMAVRRFWIGPLDHERYFGLWPMLGLWVVTFGIMGLYRGATGAARIFITPVEELRRTTVGTTWAFLTIVVVMYASDGALFFSRLILLVGWLLAVVLVPLSRAVVREFCAKRPWWGATAVVLGSGRIARRVIKTLQEMPELGLKPVGVVADRPATETHLANVPILGGLEVMRPLGRERRIPYCIVALDEDSGCQFADIHKQYGDCFPHMMIIPELGGLASLWIVARDVGGILGLEIRNNLLVNRNRWLKRGLDLAVAVPLGLGMLPVLLIAAAWIRLVSRGSALFTQEREGLHGKTIRIWKLRTMYDDADDRLKELLARDPAAQAEWSRYYKLRNDPRILPGVGTFLRRTSLDELPQLWNVLRGEMSLVGPRPFPDYHLEAFNAEFLALRRRVPPGLTGLWQVSARSEGDLEQQERLDTSYVHNWSLWLDLYLLAKTTRVVLTGRGAY
jgi:Undecaprenyl-phosphate galactose phosphotransferase WbaP